MRGPGKTQTVGENIITDHNRNIRSIDVIEVKPSAGISDALNEYSRIAGNQDNDSPALFDTPALSTAGGARSTRPDWTPRPTGARPCSWPSSPPTNSPGANRVTCIFSILAFNLSLRFPDPFQDGLHTNGV